MPDIGIAQVRAKTQNTSTNAYRLIPVPAMTSSRFPARLVVVCLAVLLSLNSLAAEKKPASKPPALDAPGWQSLFDGKSLKGWAETDYAGRSTVEVKDGKIVAGLGEMLTGINLTATNTLPRTNYELYVEGMKVQGSDFWCALTFPVGTNCCTLVLGGWGGAVVGLSSINHQDASDNETTQFLRFENNKLYKIALRVTDKKIEAWLDEEQIIDLELADRRIGMRFGDIELSQPLGLSNYQTEAVWKTIQVRKLDAKPVAK